LNGIVFMASIDLNRTHGYELPMNSEKTARREKASTENITSTRQTAQNGS